MPLRLAGEDYAVVQGLDDLGRLRTIAVNDASPGLKINQQGAGRVFDFQDGGASRLYLPDGGDITLAGSLVLATANPVTITPTNPAAPRTLTIPAVGQDSAFAFLEQAQTFTAAQTIQVAGASATPLTIQSESLSQRVLLQESFAGDSTISLAFRKSEGSLAAPAATALGRLLGQVAFWGHDGAAWVQSADLRAVTEGSIAAGQVPSRLAFFTLETAAGGLLERWRIAAAGDLKAMNGDLDLNSRSLKNAVLGTALNLNGQTLAGGGTFSGAMTFSAKPAITASVAAQGFLNVPIATAAPSAPANGDVWIEDIAGVRKLAARIGGVTYSATLA